MFQVFFTSILLNLLDSRVRLQPGCCGEQSTLGSRKCPRSSTGCAPQTFYRSIILKNLRKTSTVTHFLNFHYFLLKMLGITHTIQQNLFSQMHLSQRHSRHLGFHIFMCMFHVLGESGLQMAQKAKYTLF